MTAVEIKAKLQELVHMVETDPLTNVFEGLYSISLLDLTPPRQIALLTTLVGVLYVRLMKEQAEKL